MVSELTEEILIPPALKSKAAAGALLNRDGDRRPGAAATKFPLNALTGHVLASPEIYCASRLHSQEEYAPCRLHHALVAGSSPSVGKLISRIVESLARSSEPAVEPVTTDITNVFQILCKNCNPGKARNVTGHCLGPMTGAPNWLCTCIGLSLADGARGPAGACMRPLWEAHSRKGADERK